MGTRWYNLWELAGIIYGNSLVWLTGIAIMKKETYIDVLRRLRHAARRKTQKNGEPKVGFSFTAMLQHTGRF
jgi:hypothetical protein